MTTRHIAFERLHNFRDLGGYAAADGRSVRWGRLYRSDSLGKLTPGGPDHQRFLDLGIRTVVDLRYPWEVERGGRVPEQPGLEYHNLSIEHRPYDQAAIDPDADPWRHLADRYAEVVEDGAKEIRETLDVIAADGRPDSAPLVFHCASGKDRTGLIAALVLSLLGVGEDDILADFALTELASARLLADYRAAYPDREQIWPGYGRAPAAVLRHVLDDLTAAHGSVRGYAVERLGVDDELVGALRARLLE
ncbi:tyrosine-protein phosphatase [Streptacidiphilus carbonis]|jgi:protein-tyrosine phosphatase|uniref:tyrosine-protein phosphatase n=1 Tax=Streptacidiphilus carbonis TaxID=105422 RepID=UPI0005A66FC4|nr:tyrosine-protein phosphatase [Streptacidiphilus carbonis]